MRLNTNLKFISSTLSDVWNIRHSNYKSPRPELTNYWDEECIKHPTNSRCRIND